MQKIVTKMNQNVSLNTTMGMFANISGHSKINATNNNTLHDNYIDVAPLVERISNNINIVLFILGFFGNCLTIAVLTNIKSSITPTMIYLIALAVSDNVILIASSFVRAIQQI